MKGTAPAFEARHREAVIGAAAGFQNAYLASALARMADAVSQAFPGGNRPLPSTSDLQRCIGCFIPPPSPSPRVHRVSTLLGSSLSFDVGFCVFFI